MSMASLMTVRVHPGPEEYPVLKLQSHHRSQYLWDGKIDDDAQLRPRRVDSKFWAHVHNRKKLLSPRVIDGLSKSAFAGVFSVGRIRFDRSLITSLIERWRPETNTFHFRSGEATITLQDVEVLYGLPVDGKPLKIPEQELPHSAWKELMINLTGYDPPLTDLKGSQLRVGGIFEYLKALPEINEDDSEDEVQKQCRLFILLMIGGVVFPDLSGSRVDLRFLMFIKDIYATTEYSWGSAALACLYRNMGKASMENRKTVGGFIALLQVWAWERLLPVQPKPALKDRPLKKGESSLVLPHPPYAKKWARGVSRDKTAGHLLPLYHDQFDVMRLDRFIWQPYSREAIRELPSYCSSGSRIWASIVPLICLEIVEEHMPERVTRQFGFVQNEPSLRQVWDDHHYQKDGHFNVDEAYMLSSLSLWEKRAEKGVHGQPWDGVQMSDDDQYMKWFRRITRTLIGNPARNIDIGYQPFAGRHEALGRAVQHMYRLGVQVMNDEASHETLRKFGEIIGNVASETFIAASLDRPLSFDPRYKPASEYFPGPPVKCRSKIVGGRQDRGRAQIHSQDGRRLVDEDEEDDRLDEDEESDPHGNGSDSNALDDEELARHANISSVTLPPSPIPIVFAPPSLDGLVLSPSAHELSVDDFLRESNEVYGDAPETYVQPQESTHEDNLFSVLQEVPPSLVKNFNVESQISDVELAKNGKGKNKPRKKVFEAARKVQLLFDIDREDDSHGIVPEDTLEDRVSPSIGAGPDGQETGTMDTPTGSQASNMQNIHPLLYRLDDSHDRVVSQDGMKLRATKKLKKTHRCGT